MALVEAARFHNILEAEMARARLESDGIPAFVFDANANWEGGAVVQGRLMVDDEDLEAAREILAG